MQKFLYLQINKDNFLEFMSLMLETFAFITISVLSLHNIFH
jgi:hypothetical protein